MRTLYSDSLLKAIVKPRIRLECVSAEDIDFTYRQEPSRPAFYSLT